MIYLFVSCNALKFILCLPKLGQIEVALFHCSVAFICPDRLVDLTMYSLCTQALCYFLSVLIPY